MTRAKGKRGFAFGAGFWLTCSAFDAMKNNGEPRGKTHRKAADW